MIYARQILRTRAFYSEKPQLVVFLFVFLFVTCSAIFFVITLSEKQISRH